MRPSSSASRRAAWSTSSPRATFTRWTPGLTRVRASRRIGRLLFRRPVSAADLQALVTASREGTRLSQSFYTGLALGLETMLVSPRFLFDIDVTEPGPHHAWRQARCLLESVAAELLLVEHDA